MTDTFRAMCAELIDAWDKHGGNGLSSHEDVWFATINRARAALAEPKPPADGEVAETVKWLREEAEDWLFANPDGCQGVRLSCAADLLERLAFARAVLARWGRP